VVNPIMSDVKDSSELTMVSPQRRLVPSNAGKECHPKKQELHSLVDLAALCTGLIGRRLSTPALRSNGLNQPQTSTGLTRQPYRVWMR
jgi:hypothetical protein